MKARTIMASATFLACVAAAGAALDPDAGHSPAHSPAPVPAATPSQPAAPAASGTPVFPTPLPKKMWATRDLRGKAAPKFEVQKWITPEPQWKGKVVLIDFWATWCPPCRALIPELNDLQAKFKDDLVVIGVSDEQEDAVKKFMAKTKISYSMAVDTKATMKNAIGVQGIPHVLIVSSDGIVRWQGFPQLEEEPLTEAIVKQIVDADKAAQAHGGKPATPAPQPAASGPGGSGQASQPPAGAAPPDSSAPQPQPVPVRP